MCGGAPSSGQDGDNLTGDDAGSKVASEVEGVAIGEKDARGLGAVPCGEDIKDVEVTGGGEEGRLGPGSLLCFYHPQT